MYRELSKKNWRNWWNISSAEQPDVLIVWGIFKSIREEGYWLVTDFLKDKFKDKLKNLRPISPHAFIGDYKNMKIAITHAYGGAFSGDQVQHFIKLGAKLVILLGHFGGLTKKKIPVGRIFIPNTAYRADGTSYYFLGHSQRIIEPDKEIVKWLEKRLNKKWIPHIAGPIRTVSTMLGQTNQRIKKWQKEKFIGVDLESAVVFSIAKFNKVKSVSILHHSDHVGGGRLLNEVSKKELEEKKKARKLLVSLALATAKKFGKNKNFRSAKKKIRARAK
jgi:uridine phosphorylase